MSKFGLFVLLLLSARGEASTFIGNGGNAGDLDLAITLEEIHRTFDGLNKESTPLCVCSDDIASNPLCKVLRALTKPQIEFCQKTMARSRKQMADTSSGESPINFVWSDEPLRVTLPNGSSRVVDAVAQREKKAVIIDRDRYLDMPPAFRIALVAHELFHLVSIEDRYVSDEEAVLPYKDGKTLLDSLGAATAIAAYEEGIIRDFRGLQNASRAYRKYILQLDVKGISHTKESASNLIKNDGSSAIAFVFEYKPDAYGVRLGLENVKSGGSTISGLTVEDSLNLFSLGLGYHWMPIDRRLSRWSELHVSAFLEGLYGSANYKIGDGVMTLEDRSVARGGQLALQVHVPIAVDIWATAGAQLRSVDYDYNDLKISVHDIQQALFFGGAYAF